ncbi:MAG: glycosyltransferase [Planctomycetota bacterium]|nr:MAG: glycosyltransferase [Planctomycetota bacterium]
MRIVHLIARLNNGGPARVIEQLCQEHGRVGHESVVFTGACGPDEEDLTDQLCRVGISVVRLRHLQRRLTGWNDLLALGEIIQQLRRFRPTILHTHTAKAGFLGRMAARSLSLPCLHTYHGHVLSGYWRPAVQGMIRMSEQISARYGHCHSLSPSLVRDLSINHGIGQHRRWHTQSIPVAVPPRCLIPRERLAQQWGLSGFDPRIPTIGFLGRMVPIKDPLLFCEVVAAVHNTMPVQVIMCGDGPLRAAARQRLAALGVRHWCPGFQDTAQSLAMFDVLLMTSHNEGVPLSIIEATGSGVPVVAPSVGGIIDLDSGPALQVTTRNVERLAAATRVAIETGKNTHVIEHGRRVADYCDPVRVSLRYLGMYQQAMAS